MKRGGDIRKSRFGVSQKPMGKIALSGLRTGGLLGVFPSDGVGKLHFYGSPKKN